jgi:hypothetical protein
MKTASWVLTALFLSASGVSAGLAGCSSDSSNNPPAGDDSGASPDSGSTPDTGSPAPGKDSGAPEDSGSGQVDSSSGGDDGSSDSGSQGTDSGSGDAGPWIDMNFPDGGPNGHACDNQPGVPCGWSATNNGSGYTCACVNPTWADPWGCAAPDAGAAASCPVGDAGGD